MKEDWKERQSEQTNKKEQEVEDKADGRVRLEITEECE